MKQSDNLWTSTTFPRSRLYIRTPKKSYYPKQKELKSICSRRLLKDNYKTLTLGSTVGKTSLATYLTKEPKPSAINIIKAKIGTKAIKAKAKMNLWTYEERCLLPYQDGEDRSQTIRVH